MTRDDALELIALGKPCFYIGVILKSFNTRELCILELTDSTSRFQAARVSLSPESEYHKSVWVKLTQLAVTPENSLD
ncbi:hypothetical protein [Nostoc sp.]|uniref:hypothetical protein n=1 Tax=Nostoc sp. TaxID=1180 RepID=UPI002FFB370C